jgi:FMN phosphatase YigB (HAD superfamily)
MILVPNRRQLYLEIDRQIHTDHNIISPAILDRILMVDDSSWGIIMGSQGVGRVHLLGRAGKPLVMADVSISDLSELEITT